MRRDPSAFALPDFRIGRAPGRAFPTVSVYERAFNMPMRKLPFEGAGDLFMLDVIPAVRDRAHAVQVYAAPHGMQMQPAFLDMPDDPDVVACANPRCSSAHSIARISWAGVN